MILACKTATPISLVELGIPKLKVGELWAVADSVIAQVYGQLAGSSKGNPLDRAKRAGVLDVNPDISLRIGQTVEIKSTFMAALLFVYIIDPVAGTHHLPDEGVLAITTNELNRLQIRNLSANDLLIHVRL